MQCRICGHEVASGSVYCPQCGDRVTENEAHIKSDSASQDGSATEDDRVGEAAAADKPKSDRSKESSDGGQPSRASDRLTSRPASGTEGEEESDVWRGGYSAHAMWGHVLVAGIVTIALLVGAVLLSGVPFVWIVAAALIVLMWLALGCLLLYRKMSVDYRLTNQRFMHRAGILRRVVDRIEVIDIDDIAFEQGLIERFTGVGTIVITSSDRTHPTLTMPGIARVEQVTDAIDATRRKERAARSIHIESI
jgi:membrane protein YdbS with pleckstrin-like domain